MARTSGGGLQINRVCLTVSVICEAKSMVVFLTLIKAMKLKKKM